MSVIIPNMNMPMSCLACPLAREMFGCLVCVGFFKDNLIGRRVYKSDLKESDTDFNRPDWCPLVPLPKGHERLIDADAIIKMLNEMEADFNKNEFYQGALWYHVIAELLKKAPTIVPAEGGDKNVG